jgi:hypothetical protein
MHYQPFAHSSEPGWTAPGRVTFTFHSHLQQSSAVSLLLLILLTPEDGSWDELGRECWTRYLLISNLAFSPLKWRALSSVHTDLDYVLLLMIFIAWHCLQCVNILSVGFTVKYWVSYFVIVTQSLFSCRPCVKINSLMCCWWQCFLNALMGVLSSWFLIYSGLSVLSCVSGHLKLMEKLMAGTQSFFMKLVWKI